MTKNFPVNLKGANFLATLKKQPMTNLFFYMQCTQYAHNVVHVSISPFMVPQSGSQILQNKAKFL